jgi:hypothetical protein
MINNRRINSEECDLLAKIYTREVLFEKYQPYRIFSELTWFKDNFVKTYFKLKLDGSKKIISRKKL